MSVPEVAKENALVLGVVDVLVRKVQARGDVGIKGTTKEELIPAILGCREISEVAVEMKDSPEVWGAVWEEICGQWVVGMLGGKGKVVLPSADTLELYRIFHPEAQVVDDGRNQRSLRGITVPDAVVFRPAPGGFRAEGVIQSTMRYPGSLFDYFEKADKAFWYDKLHFGEFFVSEAKVLFMLPTYESGRLSEVLRRDPYAYKRRMVTLPFNFEEVEWLHRMLLLQDHWGAGRR